MQRSRILLGMLAIPTLLFVLLFRGMLDVQTVHDVESYLHLFNTGLGMSETEIRGGLRLLLPAHSQMALRDIAGSVPVAYLKPDASADSSLAGLFFRHACRHGLAVAPVGAGNSNTASVVRAARAKLAGMPSRGHAYDYVLGRLGGGGPLAHVRSLDGVLYGRGAGAAPQSAVDATGVFVVGLVSSLSATTAATDGTDSDAAGQQHPRQQRGGTGKGTRDTGGDAGGTAIEQPPPRLGFGTVAKDVEMLLDMVYTPYESPRHSATGMAVLLLVADRMDESVVVLRRLLMRAGWPWSLFDMVQWHASRASPTARTPSPDGAEHPRARAARSASATHAADAREQKEHKDVLDAAVARLDWHLADEAQRDGDDGKQLRFEIAALHEAQAVVAEQCSHTKALAGITHDLYSKNPRKWVEGLGKEYMINLCHWFMLDDEAYVNFELQTAGNPGELFSLIIEEQLHQMARVVERRLLLQAT